MNKSSYSKLNKKITISIILFSIVIIFSFLLLFDSLHKKSISYIKKEELSLFRDMIVKENLSVVDFINSSFKNADKIAKSELKNHVYEAYSIAKSIYFNHKGKNIPDELIKTTIKETLRKLTYRKGLEYFFIQNINGTVEMNSAFPKIEGKDISNFRDKKGKYFVKEVIKTALTKGEGYVEYYWKYKVSNQLNKKICFVKFFRPYNWIIGMTIFYEDFYNILKKDILKQLAYTVIPAKISILILTSENQIIFKKNISKPLKLNYRDFKNKNFKTFMSHGNQHYAYTIEIKNLKWKVISFSHLKDIESVINSTNQYFVNFLSKIFIVFLILLALFLGFIIFYFYNINKKFSQNFNLLKDSLVKAAKENEFENNDYDFEELQIISDIFLKIIREIKTERSITEKITENIDTGIIFVSPEMEIEYINKPGLNILGYTKGEVLGKVVRDVVQGVNMDTLDRIKEEECGIKILLANQKVIKKRLYYTRKDNSLIPVEISLIPLINNGKTEKIIITFKDISERIAREKALVEAKMLAEEAKEAKSQFLANMSHEIRTPMNAIVGFVDLLLNSDNLNEKQIKYLNIIKDSSNNLINIINDILDLAKLEKGKIEYEMRNFSIRNLIKECADVFRFKAEEKGLNLIYSVDEKIPEMVKGDKFRINQVLNNLVSNAIKFTSKGSVTIIAELINRSEDKVKIKFSVSDTGIGISEDKVEKIFETFSQADSSTTRKFGGTGLGLTICKNLVNQMGGKLQVESEYGRGSIFYFTLELPLGDEITLAEVEEIDDSQEVEKLKGLKVLIVEDDIFNQTFLQEILNKYGITTDIAGTGIEALKKLEKDDFDIVLMDIEMPEMNGYETVEVIRDIEKGVDITNISSELKNKLKGKNLKIIALTGHDDDTHKRKIFDTGFNDYTTKPINIEELISKILEFVSTSNEKISSKRNLIDIESLKELVGDNEEIINSLKNKFFENINKDFLELKNAFKEKDFVKIKEIAHKMKGSSGNMRAIKLQEICHTIEHISLKRDIDEIGKLINEIDNLLLYVD